ncbi:MAG: galactose mutarotase [Clostridiales bacterium]|nr:galactose mutarotase [Clostridiales bacterium]
MSIVKEFFGKTKEGISVDLYTVTNSNGTIAKLTNYGAILVSLFVPDKDGQLVDVVLGYDNLEGYFTNGPNFGATIGRHANRIGNSKFVINGVQYNVDKNDGKNNLHSGFDGFHKRVWEGNAYEGELGYSLEFTYHSKDKDQGFPGNLDVRVIYTLTNEDSLIIEYYGVSDEDTIVNLTNHSYFNLSGHNSGDVLKQKVWIDSDYITESDAESIPTGVILPVKNTAMDFNKPKDIGKEIDSDYYQVVQGKGYDHNWVLKNIKGEIALVARMEDKYSRIGMEVFTDMPGMQFYTGNFLDDTEIGKGGKTYGPRSGACFETQYYPNAMNIPDFPSPLIKAGEEYKSTTVYKFYTK